MCAGTSRRVLVAGAFASLSLALGALCAQALPAATDSVAFDVIDTPDGPAAAGGWSARRTLYGGDQMKGDTDPRLDPGTEPVVEPVTLYLPGDVALPLARMHRAILPPE